MKTGIFNFFLTRQSFNGYSWETLEIMSRVKLVVSLTGITSKLYIEWLIDSQFVCY